MKMITLEQINDYCERSDRVGCFHGNAKDIILEMLLNKEMTVDEVRETILNSSKISYSL